jgi:hypothetical protein|tara:strand:+ start:3311 stop:3688 length:378 start_codon:yes stop_codon:yes gene_type:complete
MSIYNINMSEFESNAVLEEVMDMEMTGGSKEMFKGPDGKEYMSKTGSRRQVFGTSAHKPSAYMTTGGLTKKDLVSSHGRIVSKKKHLTAKKEKRLEKHGYFAKKGKFGFVKRKTRKTRKNKSAKK